jgi:hypothetical protein
LPLDPRRRTNHAFVHPSRQILASAKLRELIRDEVTPPYPIDRHFSADLEAVSSGRIADHDDD